MSKNKERGISRIDSGYTRGWLVRGYKNGRTHSRLFSDGKYGGRIMAWEAALVYRDELLAYLSRMPSMPRKRHVMASGRQHLKGVPGVCRTVKRSAAGMQYACYSVSWRPEPGVQKSTSYSIRKYGEKKAYELAVAHRLRMVGLIYGEEVLGRCLAAALVADVSSGVDLRASGSDG